MHPQLGHVLCGKIGGMSFSAFFRPVICIGLLSLTACGSQVSKPATLATSALTSTEPAPVRIGLALGGGAAKGFAHIGVIKMLEAHGFTPDVVAGTSAGSVVGALYASGMDAFALQQKAVALDETTIRDLQLSATGLLKGQKLQDYVNSQVNQRSMEKLGKPFVAVVTRLEDGKRTVFARGNTGQAVRASSSIPGVFEAVRIGAYHYVDGGVTSPVPVDAARELGADIVVAVDISDKPRGKTPANMLGAMSQSIAIMGQRLGQAELARADVIVRPKVLDIGPNDFSQRTHAIAEGEKAALAVMPELRHKVQQLHAQRAQAAQQAQQLAARERLHKCLQERSSLQKIAGTVGLNDSCK